MLKNAIVFVVALGIGYFAGARDWNANTVSEKTSNAIQLQRHVTPASNTLGADALLPNVESAANSPTPLSWEGALDAVLEERSEGVKKYKALMAIASLPVADQISLIHNLKSKTQTPENIELLKSIAYLLASEHPDSAFALLADLPEDEKSVVGMGIVFGVASTNPEKAWQWAEANMPYNKSTAFLTRNEFKSFLSITLQTMAKDPENQWHAYELATNVEGGSLNGRNWAKFQVAQIIAKNDTDATITRILEAQNHGVSDPDLVVGVVSALSKRDLNETAQFIIENQNIIPRLAVTNLSASYIEDERLDDYYRLMATIDNKDLYESMVNDAASKFPEVGLDDTIRLVQSIDDQKLKHSVMITASVHMESLPYSFEEHMQFFDNVLENMAERYDNYSFTSALYEWSKKSPEQVRVYIDNLPNDDENSIELLYEGMKSHAERDG